MAMLLYLSLKCRVGKLTLHFFCYITATNYTHPMGGLDFDLDLECLTQPDPQIPQKRYLHINFIVNLAKIAIFYWTEW